MKQPYYEWIFKSFTATYDLVYDLWHLTSLQQCVEQGGVGKEEEVAKGLGGEGRRQTRLPRQHQGTAVNFYQACDFWG